MKVNTKQSTKHAKTSGVKAFLNIEGYSPGSENDQIFDIEDKIMFAFDLLVEHFKPQDFVEEMWLHNIATIMVNIEKFRAIEQSVMLNQMLEAVMTRQDGYDYLRKHQYAANDYAKSLSLGKPHNNSGSLHDGQKIAANLSESDIRQLAAINDLIIKQQRERDKIFLQFERRRRLLVEAAVAKVEEKGLPPQLPD